jgi:hypothetical protein
MADYRAACRQARLPLLASQQIIALRQSIEATRRLLAFVDNGFTNATVLKDLPDNTALVGQIRKDAKLYWLPEETASAKRRGRPRYYGAPAPTPEQVRTDDSIHWQTVGTPCNWS